LRLKTGLDQLRSDGRYDAFAIRCWPETFTEYGGAVCGPAGMMGEAGVPCGPINSIDQTFAEPQVQHLGIAQPMHHPVKGSVKVVGQPVHLERTPQPPEIRKPTPDAGGNTDEVLAELGYDEARIDDLRQRGVV